MEMEKITSIARNNAIISYCFLAFFMLLSRQENFKNSFVRSHARYAFLLHLVFLALIIALIRSENFSSLLLYNINWIHIIFFIGFLILLGLLGSGMYQAFHGKKPRISLDSFSLRSIQKGVSEQVNVTQEEKTLIILAHIPFLGSYLGKKYGGEMLQGEKFSYWFLLAIIISLILNPGMFIAIAMIIIVTFLLIYQMIDGQKGTVSLLGKNWWNVTEIEIYLASIGRYLRAIVHHDSTLPSWEKISEEEKTNYKPLITANITPLIFMPIINIVHIITNWKVTESRTLILESIFVTGIMLYGIFFVSTVWILTGSILIVYGYFSLVFKRDVRIPILYEIAITLQHLIEWKRKKSVPESIQLIQKQ